MILERCEEGEKSEKKKELEKQAKAILQVSFLQLDYKLQTHFIMRVDMIVSIFEHFIVISNLDWDA